MKRTHKHHQPLALASETIRPLSTQALAGAVGGLVASAGCPPPTRQSVCACQPQ